MFQSHFWFNVHEVVKSHKHQVTLDTVSTRSQNIVVYVLTSQRVHECSNGLSLTQQLSHKFEAVKVTDGPDDAVHKVDRVDDQQVRVQVQ